MGPGVGYSGIYLVLQEAAFAGVASLRAATGHTSPIFVALTAGVKVARYPGLSLSRLFR